MLYWRKKMNANEDKQRSVKINKRENNNPKQFKIKAIAYDRSYTEIQQRIHTRSYDRRKKRKRKAKNILCKSSNQRFKSQFVQTSLG